MGFSTSSETVIIMLNVFDSVNIKNIYDIKGKDIYRNSNGYILKEDSWIENKVKLKGAYKESLVEQISKDCLFLLTNNIMDYSLVVATYQESIDLNFKMHPEGICKLNSNSEFNLGIVDILTKYTKIKKLECAMNFFCCLRKSCVDPQTYFKRFIEFINNEIFEG